MAIWLVLDESILEYSIEIQSPWFASLKDPFDHEGN